MYRIKFRVLLICLEKNSKLQYKNQKPLFVWTKSLHTISFSFYFRWTEKIIHIVTYNFFQAEGSEMAAAEEPH